VIYRSGPAKEQLAQRIFAEQGCLILASAHGAEAGEVIETVEGGDAIPTRFVVIGRATRDEFVAQSKRLLELGASKRKGPEPWLGCYFVKVAPKA